MGLTCSHFCLVFIYYCSVFAHPIYTALPCLEIEFTITVSPNLWANAFIYYVQIAEWEQFTPIGDQVG